MYDPKTIKAENNQRSLLKIVDGGHILADHSFDHMSHNSKDSPQNAYTNVERDMVNIFFQKISQAFLYILKSWFNESWFNKIPRFSEQMPAPLNYFTLVNSVRFSSLNQDLGVSWFILFHRVF